jgi:cytochrome P450
MSAPATLPRTLRTVPQMPGVPLLGNAPLVARDVLTAFSHAFAQHGDLVGMKLGPSSLYLASHPDLAQQVLVEGAATFLKMEQEGRPSQGLGLLGGMGLLTNPNTEHWRAQRRMMQPMFHRARLAEMGDKMVAAGGQMLARWKTLDTVDIDAEMLNVTMDIICRTMFSADISGSAGRAAQATEVALQFLTKLIFSAFKMPLSWPLPANRRFAQAIETIDEIIYNLIDARTGQVGQFGDLLDMLLEARDADTGEPMSRQQVRDEVVTVFSAGHETTAHSLAWTWYLLAQHPDILTRMQAELDTVLAARTPTTDDLKVLPYTTQVFQEAMRLYPAAPVIPRRIVGRSELGGYELHGPARVITSVYNIHRHPDFWPDPLHFDPERFSPENSVGRHRLAYKPFGAGSRMCIGNNLAMMEGVLLLAMVGQNYSLELLGSAPVIPKIAITLQPLGGIRMRLLPRG